MRAMAAVLLVALAGCDLDVFGPDLWYVNRRPLEPVPDWYAAEYADMEACVGWRGDFGAVRWYVADAVLTGPERHGAGIEFPNEITFAGWNWIDRYTIRHEAEHHIRQRGNDIHLPNGQTPCERAVPLS